MNPQVSKIIIEALSDFNPDMIGVFGSFARGEENEQSDLDILVRFKSAISLLKLIHIEQILSKKLGRKVDLVSEGALKNQTIKESVYKDLKVIYH